MSVQPTQSSVVTTTLWKYETIVAAHLHSCSALDNSVDLHGIHKEVRLYWSAWHQMAKQQ